METTSDTFAARLRELAEEQEVIKKHIQVEVEKLEDYTNHAKRVKHDYTTFIRTYIKLLADKDMVRDLLNQ